MKNRNRERGDDRERENAIWHRDIGEGDDRDPEDIEERNRNTDCVRAEPVEPADAVFALLLAGQRFGGRQHAPPMLADQLESAECPAVPLPLIGFERIGQESMPVAAICVVRQPSLLEDAHA